MNQDDNLSGFQHPMSVSSSRNLLRLLWENRGVDPQYRRRVAEVLTMSLLTSPLRWYERLRYNAAIARIEITRPPIFIVGHWRSGTTYLHNLMAHDPQLGYLSSIQSYAPELMFIGEALLRRQAAVLQEPRPRPMDNMLLSLDSPQEEEITLANLTTQSAHHEWTFPRRADFYFEHYTLLQDLSPKEYRRWQQTYRWLLKKLTLRHSGRQLVMKNPANTGRIKALRDTFPGAKFIHIHRNPYEVFVSTKHLYRKAHPLMKFQSLSPAEDEQHILRWYALMMRKLIAEQSQIPAEDFIEVRFTDLEREPLATVRRIYETLRLSGWEQAEPRLQAYVATLGDYRKNRFEHDPQAIEQVNRHWAFAFEHWDYQMQHVESAAA
ncbi:MAG TPA: sulfotransferase [Herpetosiphonaceae bacterium]